MKLRHRPDGQCFQCSQIKPELMSDPLDPNKELERMWIYCDECYNKIYAEYLRKGPYQY